MSLLGKLAKGVVKGVGGLIRSNVGRVVGGVIGGPVGIAVGAAISTRGGNTRPRPGASILPRGIGGPGGFQALGRTFGGGQGRINPDNGACPKGYHLNKARTTDGLAARSVCVRNRSINHSNGRANQRAIRRLKGATKQFRRVFSMTTGKAAGKIKPRGRR